MAVNVVDLPSIELFIPGKDIVDPLPIGIWRFQAFATGDASGGHVMIACSPSVADSLKYIWSFEDYSLHTDTAVATMQGLMSISTQERIGNALNPVEPLIHHFLTNTVQVGLAITDGVKLIAQTSPLMPYIWRTDPWAAPLAAWSIAHYWNINVAARVYDLGLWGYIWHRQARTLAGGPRRP